MSKILKKKQRKVVTVLAMKTQWSGGRAPLIPISALDKGERLTTRPGSFTGNTVLGKAPSYLPNRRLGGLHNLSARFGQATKLLPLSAVRPPCVTAVCPRMYLLRWPK